MTESFLNFRKNISNSTNEQIVDGLDHFYTDYRNRAILLTHAASVVMRAIGGESPSLLDEVTTNIRRADAADPKDEK